jgi:hypothetical protein
MNLSIVFVLLPLDRYRERLPTLLRLHIDIDCRLAVVVVVVVVIAAWPTK